jgi:REP-associated tyrosine transposase
VHTSHPIRKSLKRREVVGGIRFLTFSCQRRLPLLSNPDIAQVFAESLETARDRSGLELFAWVVMPEHVHLLVEPPVSNDGVQSPLSPILKGLKSSVARRVLARWAALDAPILSRIDDGKGHPRFWQKGGGFDRNVRDEREFSKTVQYIHRNPVERGLVERCEDWQWSSVRWWMGRRDGSVRCDPPPGDQKAWRAWRGFM